LTTVSGAFATQQQVKRKGTQRGSAEEREDLFKLAAEIKRFLYVCNKLLSACVYNLVFHRILDFKRGWISILAFFFALNTGVMI